MACVALAFLANLVLVDANGVPTPACDGIMVPGRKKKCFRCAKGRHACERVVDPEHLPSLASKRQEPTFERQPTKTGPTDPLPPTFVRGSIVDKADMPLAAAICLFNVPFLLSHLSLSSVSTQLGADSLGWCPEYTYYQIRRVIILPKPHKNYKT